MIITIIPARGGSKRIPNKNITNFCGRPLLAWSIEQALQSKNVDAVYVSTDSEEIKKVALQNGAKVIDRPAELASDFSSSEDALKHAVLEAEKMEGQKIDLVIFLQATSPLRETKDVDNAIKTIKGEQADSLFSGAPLGDFLIWKKDGDQLTSMNYDYLNRKRSQEFGEQYVENGSIYVFKPNILFNNNNRFGGKIAVSIMDFWKSFEIDEYEDIEFCENLFKLKGLYAKQHGK